MSVISYYYKNFQNSAVQKPNELYRNRTFQQMDGSISGRSVVIDSQNGYPGKEEAHDMWLYSLSDYLKGFINRTVLVECILPNNRYSEKRGRLMIVGTNFIGLQPMQSDRLILLELSSVRCISILNCSSVEFT